MIYNRDESEVTVLGEVQKHKVSIDERNINHIVTILSSNLYSYPMTSFLREIVSNAVDSHVEAKSNEPIIIQRTATDLSIRDFGTGISPERFEEIFLNIGSSTKRESNDYIGSFGIGRFSSLAVADLVNITSFYEGKAYYYVMNKDIDQLHIDLLDILPTQEHNGVEVKIPLSNWDPKTLKCLAFINNLYVETEVSSEQFMVSAFNRRKVHTYKNFKLLDWLNDYTQNETEVLLGKIPYKVDYNSLWDANDSWHRSWANCFLYVYPQMEIGQIDITPNRENLLYSERTKKALILAYDACIEELQQLWYEAYNKEYENISDFIEHLTSYVDNTLEMHNIHVPVSDKLTYNASYKKYPWWDKIDSMTKKGCINALLLNKEIRVICEIRDETIYKGRHTTDEFNLKKLLRDWIKYDYKMVLALPSGKGISSDYFKGYINEKYGNTHKLLITQLPPKLSYSYIKQMLRSIYGISMLTDSEYRRFVLQLMREVLQYVKNKIIITDVFDSPEYIQYKKDHCAKKNRKYIPTEKICFTITGCDGSFLNLKKTTCALNEIIPYVKENYGEKTHIVYAELENPLTDAFKGMKYPNLVVLSAAKNKMPLLYQGLPDYVKGIETLYSPDNRVLQKYAAIHYIRHQPGIDNSFTVWRCFPNPIQKAIAELSKYKKQYDYIYKSYDSYYDATSIIESIPFEKYDIKIMALWNQLKSWLELSYRMDYKMSLLSFASDLSYYILMKNKKFRMDYEFYANIKENIKHLLESI